MTEEEFLAALPGPGEPETTIVLPDFAAHQLATRMWNLRLVVGGSVGTMTRAGSLTRTFKGRLTADGALRLTELREGAVA